MSQPTIVLVSQSDKFTDFSDKLGDYHIIYQHDTHQYMNTLIENQVAMIIVDGTHLDWQRFTTTPKSSPATRRIPVVFVSDVKSHHSDAIVAGADLTYKFEEIQKQLTQLIQDYGRIPNSKVIEQLDCECQDSLPSLAIEGVKKFNAGEYYPQHDLFEEQWVNTEGPVRDLYRAILQVGVAYYQIERGNFRGALKMLQRSVQWLAILPDVCQGVNVAQLRQDSYTVRAELERLGADRLDELDHNLLRPVQLVDV